MASTETDKRYIRESGLEARIAAIVAPVAESLGYALVRVRVLPENGCTLQIMAEDPNGRFAIEDCEALSHELSPVLDVEDPIDREYHLEVSSPGVDRPLVRPRDFARYVGHDAKVELNAPLEGRKRFRGEITGVGDEHVGIRLPDAPHGADPVNKLPLGMIAEAKLVMSQALLDAAQAEQQDDDTLNSPDVETVEDTSEEN